MKSVKKTKWVKGGVLLMGAFFSFSTFAGSQEGHGGGAIVCRDKADDRIILHAELYDLWEGERNQIQVQRRSDLTAKEQVDLAVSKLKSIHSVFGESIENELQNVMNQINSQLSRFDGTYLPDPKDVVLVRMPSECPGNPSIRPEYETVVNYLESKDVTGKSIEVLEVDPLLYQSLNTETDRAGILLHEAIYKILRETQRDESSQNTREIVAALLSETQKTKEITERLKRIIQGSLSPESLYRILFVDASSRAIKNNDPIEIKKLLKKSVSVYGEIKKLELEKLGDPVFYQAFQNDESGLTLLDEYLKYFDINQPRVPIRGDHRELSPLTLASSSGSLKLAQKLLSLPGIKLDPEVHVSSEGEELVYISNNPLFQAIRYGKTQIVKLILGDSRMINLRKGVERDVYGKVLIDNKRTPLGFAIEYGNLETLNLLLLDPRTDVNELDDGVSPLVRGVMVASYGVRTKAPNPLSKLERLLNDKRIDINAQDGEALRKAISLSSSYYPENAVIVKLLLKRADLDVNQIGGNGRHPLHEAVTYGNEEVLALLLNDSRTDVEAADQNHLLFALGTDWSREAPLLLTLAQNERVSLHYSGNQSIIYRLSKKLNSYPEYFEVIENIFKRKNLKFDVEYPSEHPLLALMAIDPKNFIENGPGMQLLNILLEAHPELDINHQLIGGISIVSLIAMRSRFHGNFSLGTAFDNKELSNQARLAILNRLLEVFPEIDLELKDKSGKKPDYYAKPPKGEDSPVYDWIQEARKSRGDGESWWKIWK